jgi:hypothetical protein
MVLKMHMAKTPRATIRFEYFFYEWVCSFICVTHLFIYSFLSVEYMFICVLCIIHAHTQEKVPANCIPAEEVRTNPDWRRTTWIRGTNCDCNEVNMLVCCKSAARAASGE